MTSERRPEVHDLKSDPIPFEDAWSGSKKAEVRVNDRNFQVRDWLFVREFREGRVQDREFMARITHIQSVYGLPENLVVLSFQIHEWYVEGQCVTDEQAPVADAYALDIGP